MDHPVHHYRGYEILCSLTGYTVMKGGIEVLNIGAEDADPTVPDRASVNHVLDHAKHAVDRLIAEAVP
ncbi:hypothetical protein [Luteibacter aegosomatissinici]|uniref:hypothetical protein n=1 Tax=Luteibacter aegosomatissinici TaxID=2911539 RepID=UPI001FFC0006|nr:hypothetical protein [Luteibacter aegosomatissinici]UPG93370.1 hypothetical protein L2Y97_16145 [Luteibacter aegosomatissinici]